MQPQTTNSLAVPIAIIIGFGMIAAAILFSGSTNTPTPGNVVGQPNQPATERLTVVRPIDETDHIKGNPNAPIMVVEYSDYNCPFCKSFHDTMNRVMDEYGVDGNVAWVYRQFPILGPDSVRVSEAAFCVAELGGSAAKFAFSDAVFNRTENRTNMTLLSEFAEMAGVDRAEFDTCLASGRQASSIEAALLDGQAAGVEGTPYSIVMVGDQQAVINGAQPYEVVRNIIETLNRQLEGRPVPAAE